MGGMGKTTIAIATFFNQYITRLDVRTPTLMSVCVCVFALGL